MFQFASRHCAAYTMGKSKGSKPGKGKDSLAKARPSALKKPTAKDDRATNTKAKSSKKVSFRDEKAEGKKEASKAKAAEIVEEVLKRAREANANKRDKVAKETKKDTKKEKEKQAETATAASKKTGDEKGKKKGIEKHVEEKEKKRDEKKMCDEKDKAAKTSSAAGTVTPPVKRHRMKSPPLSEASAESCKHLLELEQAAREATARAEMDAGCIDGFLDELRDLVASGVIPDLICVQPPIEEFHLLFHKVGGKAGGEDIPIPALSVKLVPLPFVRLAVPQLLRVLFGLGNSSL